MSNTMLMNKTHPFVCVFLMISIGIMFFGGTTASTQPLCHGHNPGDGCPKLLSYEDFQGAVDGIEQGIVGKGKSEVSSLFTSRRVLVGPGSHRPYCRTKCMQCTPCTPILVSSTGKEEYGEYYPRAWKCTCHNKLYDP